MTEQRLLRSVQRLATALTRLERQTAADNGVSVSQLRILLYLAQDAPGDGVRITDLAQEQGLAVSTMTRNLALLEKKGWVMRLAGTEDRRTVHVRLTEEGSSRSSLLHDNSIGKLNLAFRSFHPTDRIERAVALDRVAAALEVLDGDRSPVSRLNRYLS